MGTTSSTSSRLADNAWLHALCSATPQDREFWERASTELSLSTDDDVASTDNDNPEALRHPHGILLSFLKLESLQESLQPHLDKLFAHTHETGALGGLLFCVSEWLCAAVRQEEEGYAHNKKQNYLANALVLVRLMLQEVMARGAKKIALLHAQLNTLSPGLGSLEGDIDVVNMFTSALFQYLCDTNLGTQTYLVHVECINTLNVMFSTQLYAGLWEHKQYSPFRISPHVFLEAAMDTQSQFVAQGVVHTLLTHYTMHCISYPDHAEGNAFFSEVARAIARPVISLMGTIGHAASSILLFPLQAYRSYVTPEGEPLLPTTIPKQDDQVLDRMSQLEKELTGILPELLGSRSALVLLLLCLYRKRDDSCENPFLRALRHISGDDVAVTGHISGQVGIKVTYENLYMALTRSTADETAVLILYTLLNENKNFRNFVLSKTDVDVLLLPILKRLYSVRNLSADHISMIFTVLLMLSQDHSFCSNIHKQILHRVPWYKDQVLHNISLGSLLIVLISKTIRYNMTRLKDPYLNSTCLGVASNLAPHFHRLHPHAAQRLLSLLSLTAKQCKRSLEASDEERELHERFYVSALDIFNSCLTYSATNNLALVYEMIHDRPMLEHALDVNLYSGESNSSATDYVNNIKTVVNFFENKLDQEANQNNWGNIEEDSKSTESHENDKNKSQDPTIITSETESEMWESYKFKEWSVEYIMSILERYGRNWNSADHLQVFPVMQFQYEEVQNPQEFFVPYVWAIIIESMKDLLWHRQRVILSLPIDDTTNLTDEQENQSNENDIPYVETEIEDSFVNQIDDKNSQAT
eukprot:gb/GECH01014524.1/.p1 GENE.gb/GECH01014524.1/~~gb/GECH01014524.1/.p1  ORF type:complete len:813 (+),score=122.21 gb/GECH01014524.1/:1-2439(+)